MRGGVSIFIVCFFIWMICSCYIVESVEYLLEFDMELSDAFVKDFQEKYFGMLSFVVRDGDVFFYRFFSEDFDEKRSVHDEFLDMKGVDGRVVELRERVKRESIDPLLPSQWYLIGPGVNIHVEPVWDMGYTGKGVVIAVVDDGIESSHPDFTDSIRYDSSYNFNYFNEDIDPRTSSFWHGTAVAGCAAANADGDTCGVGVAPGAELSAIVLLQKEELSDSVEAQALGYKRNINHIYSSCWGPKDDGMRLEKPGQLAHQVIENSIKKGRNGLGSIYVWAAGNGATFSDNCNYDGYANMRYTLTVGSVDFYGEKTSYSEPCAALIAVTPSNSLLHYVYTTGLITDNSPKCNNYFTGTSASCSLMSGVVALILEANPNLTWLEVQYIVVHSSHKTGTGDWTLNGAGYDVSHQYGFGLIDAYDAVLAAERWNTTKIIESTVVYRMISNQNSLEDFLIQSVAPVEYSVQIHHVQVTVNILHPSRGSLKIILCSPMGSTSILADSHPDTSPDYSNWTFTSLIHWGEDCWGNWTLILFDKKKQDFILSNWTISFFGIQSQNSTNGTVVDPGASVERTIVIDSEIKTQEYTTSESRGTDISFDNSVKWIFFTTIVSVLTILVFIAVIFAIIKINRNRSSDDKELRFHYKTDNSCSSLEQRLVELESSSEVVHAGLGEQLLNKLKELRRRS
eukprot:TRINITY_DN1261_c0_g1_i1.p1 TRINITY_DN1261_c0_g1~~TRINITY_DN1261_c0_g1_i1.p1  ORF type:complete len:683 (-),score=135.73 TRINITY_DN1261_c0_g1_i1:8-2056(-)